MPALPESLLPSEEDLVYEEEILRNPFSLKLWWRYLLARKNAPTRKRWLIYERALKALPGSYKLWHNYLSERRVAVRGLPISHPSYEALNNTFERALVTMHKMPRIWLEYIEVLLHQKVVTRTRRTCDRALCSLPITQHDRIWHLYLKFVKQAFVPVESAQRVWRRYLKLEPSAVEEYVDFLQAAGHWQEAAHRLAACVNEQEFLSRRGKSKHQLWLELCELVTKHAAEVKGLKVDAILRSGIRTFSAEVGRLWTSLADFYIRRALFERARDVYEEGMVSVLTVRDFAIVFDAYTQFEESMLAAKMEALAAEEGGLEAEAELDLRVARLEWLMERRPELVSSVLLRQNPHNVHEWHKRAKLFQGNALKQIRTYTEAVKTVDPAKALGKPHTLWVSFAKLYEAHGDLGNARVVFERATQAPFKAVDDLASVWCEWAELELRHKQFPRALALLARATQEPLEARAHRREGPEEGPVQLRLFRSLKLWSFYVDLVESLEGLAAARSVYDRILDLRIATPQMVINYATALEAEKFFEDAFRVYERGVHAFKYPHVKLLWQAYLTKFVARYGGKKLERARDLFEQALEQAPAEQSPPLFLQYAKLEEEHGLARHAMAVYERAVKTVPEAERLAIYDIYIARAAEFFGVSRTREIYESAIESGLPDAAVKGMCLRYAALERQLGEIDRARAIYVHASQLADPRSEPAFWQDWNNFEIQHGNEDTFREMLRIKRSVAASYSQVNFMVPEHLLGKAPPAEAGQAAPRTEDDMVALERAVAAAAPAGRAMHFVSSTEAAAEVAKAMGADAAPAAVQGMAANPEEIELGEGDESDEEDSRVDVALKEVPVGVFGDLADQAKKLDKDLGKHERDKDEEVPLGALERIKRQRNK